MTHHQAYRLLWGLILIIGPFLPNRANPGRFASPEAAATFEKVYYGSGDYEYYLSTRIQTDSLNFTTAGNLIILQATVNNQSGNFILDTGAPGLILNATYFRHLPALEAMVESAGITGPAHAAEKVVADNFALGSFDYSRVMADRVNLGHIENSKGIKILGLIGVGLLRKFEMLIDPVAQVLYLNRSMSKNGFSLFQKTAAALPKPTVMPMQWVNNKVLIQVKAAQSKLSFVLDTGAESNVLDGRLSEKVTRKVQLDRRVTVIGSGNQKLDAWYGTLIDAELSPGFLVNLEVMITSLGSMSEAYGRNIDGMLGNQFFKKGLTGFDFVTGKMYIWHP